MNYSIVFAIKFYEPAKLDSIWDFNVCSVSYTNNDIENIFNVNEIALPEHEFIVRAQLRDLIF